MNTIGLSIALEELDDVYTTDSLDSGTQGQGSPPKSFIPGELHISDYDDSTDSLSYAAKSQNPTLSLENPLISELFHRNNDTEIHPLEGEPGTKEGSSSSMKKRRKKRLQYSVSYQNDFFNFARQQGNVKGSDIIRAWQKKHGASSPEESCLRGWIRAYNKQAQLEGSPIIGTPEKDLAQERDLQREQVLNFALHQGAIPISKITCAWNKQENVSTFSYGAISTWIKEYNKNKSEDEPIIGKK